MSTTRHRKALGVALLDYDADGWLDLFVANDTQPNRLYRNRGNGTFVDVAVQAGVAFNEAGVARAGMGVDAADYDGSGRQSLVIGNFSNEMMALYHNEGTGLFIDEAPTSTLGRATLLTLTFGASSSTSTSTAGSTSSRPTATWPTTSSACSPRSSTRSRRTCSGTSGNRRFEDITDALGAAFAKPRGGAREPPTATSTTTATSTCWSPPTTARRACSATTGGTVPTAPAWPLAGRESNREWHRRTSSP